MKLMSLCLLSTICLGTVNSAMAENIDKVNIWNWSYNIGEHTVADFEKDTGLKTSYVEYDSNELQEARLLAGNTGFDAAVVVSYYVPRMAKSGALQKIDHSKIPNWVKLNHARLEKMATLDPNNDYAYPYIEISIGIGYNKQKIEEIFGKDYKIDSWDFLFKKENSDKLKKCGIAVIDSPIEVISAVQHYLGKDPLSQKAEDYEEAKKILTNLAANTAYFQSNRYVTDLASGEICVAIGYSGDIIQGRHLAAHGKHKYDIEYVIPKEGTNIWYDGWVITKGSENVENAHKWIDFLCSQEAAYDNFEYIYYGTPNIAAQELIDEDIINNPGVFPDEETIEKCEVYNYLGEEAEDMYYELWKKVK